MGVLRDNAARPAKLLERGEAMSRRNANGIGAAERGEVQLLVRIGREQLSAVLGTAAGRPVTVDQRSCERVIGISRGDYLRACRAGAFACRAEGKRRVALTDDVERFWTRGLGASAAANSDQSLSPGVLGAQASSPGATGEVPDADSRDDGSKKIVKADEFQTAAQLRQKYRLVRTS